MNNKVISFLAASAVCVFFISASKVGGIVRFGEDITVGVADVINGPVVAIGGNVDAAGVIKGEVVAIGGSVTLADTAKVQGQAVSIGGHTKAASGAVVEGSMMEFPAGTIPLEKMGKSAAPIIGVLGGLVGGFWIAYKIFSSLGWIALAIITFMLFPKSFETSWDTLSRQPWKSAILGVLLWPALALLGCFLIVSILGIPAVPLLVLGTILAWFWAFTTLSYGFGLKISNGKWQPALFVLAGGLILKVVTWIPLAGFIPCLAIGTFGMGAVLISRFGTRKLSTKKNLATQE